MSIRRVKSSKFVHQGWAAGNTDGSRKPTLDDIENMLGFPTFNTSSFVTIIVTGVPEEVYPGKETEDVISLSYVMPWKNAVAPFDYKTHPVTTPEEWAGEVFQNYDYGYGWKEVNQVYILDK